MPSKPRSEIFDRDHVGVYHCWNRLVRQRHLFGLDLLTGKDYSYRKSWVRNRLRELAASMAIDILDYAIMDNHLHVVLRNRPDIVAQWTDEEVARRWWQVCPRRKANGKMPKPKDCEIGLLMQNVDEYRCRLSDISWLMRLACQPIARRANREDDVDGRFFARRFDCRRLETEAELLTCSLYVDLNVIHAGRAETPEESEFTSAFDRIRARWQSVQSELETTVLAEEDADAWLAPMYLDEGANASQPKPEAPDRQPDCHPIGSPRLSDKGFLSITLDQYLTLLDTLGRMIRRGKRGHIPAELPPILQRLHLEPLAWFDRLIDVFRRPPDSARPPAFAMTG